MELSSLQLIETKVNLVGAVGIELKSRLKPRNLLILRTRKIAEISEFAESRYTPGTRSASGLTPEDAPREPAVHTSKLERI